MKKPPGRSADLLLTGAHVFTGNPQQPRAEAIATHGNRIVAVGTAEGLAGLAGKGTRVIELPGKLVCPGFIDCHVHLMTAGLALWRADLGGCASREAIIERLRQKESTLPQGAWLLGRGWDQELLGGTWPHRQWLDEAFGDRPVFLWRVDGHVAWASTSALAIAGVGEAADIPQGGQVIRDDAGQPTGIVTEGAADLVQSAAPPPNAAERREAIEAALAELRRNGVTSVHELSPPETLRTYSELRDEARLTVRISAWADLVEDLSGAEQMREQFPATDPTIRCDTLKGFIDGSLGAGTAALLDPYVDNPSSTGVLRWDEEGLAAVVRKGHRSGFQVALHAVGDRAVHLALSVLDGLGGGGRVRRHRIEHAEVVSPGDLPRFLSVGAVAGMQAGQLISDSVWLERRLGAGRLGRIFPWRQLLDQGTPLIMGSDWPIEPLNPARTIAAAVGSVEMPGISFAPDGSWRAGKNLTVAETLTAMTKTAAWSTFEEQSKGSLQAGMLADVVVLSADPFSVPPEEIGKMDVEMTIFDGRVVHSRQ